MSKTAWYLTACLLLELLSLGGLIPVTRSNAQEQGSPSRDKAKQLHEQARAFWDKQQWYEAEGAYLEALQAHEAMLSDKNVDNAILLRWCQCRGELCELHAYLQKRPEMKALSDSTLAYLVKLIPYRTREPELRLELARTHLCLSKGYQYLQLPLDSTIQQGEAVQILKKLVEDYPARLDFRLALSRALNNYGGLLMELARFPDAESCYREALRLAEAPGNGDTISPEAALQCALVQNAHAYLLNESGRHTESVQLIRQAIRRLSGLETSHPQQPEMWYLLPDLYANLAQPEGNTGNDAEMQTARREGERIEAKLAKVPEGDRKWLKHPDRVRPTIQALDVQKLSAQPAAIEELLKKAEKDTQDRSAVPLYHQRLAFLRGLYAIQLTLRSQGEAAKKEFQQAMDIMSQVNERFPGIPANRYVQADLHITYAMTFIQNGKDQEGSALLGQGVALLEKLASDYPKVPQFRLQIAEHYKRLALIQAARGQDKEAVRYYREFLNLTQKLAENHKDCPRFRRNHAMGHMTLFKLQYQAQAYAEAEAALREGLRLWPRTVADFPGIVEMQTLWASNQGMLGQYYLRRDRLQEADEAYRNLLPIAQRLITEHPQKPEYQTNMAVAYLWMAELREKQDRGADAIDCYQRAIGLWESAVKLNPRQQDWRNMLRETVQKRSFVYLKMGRLTEYQNDSQRYRELGEELDSPSARLIRIEYRSKQGELPRALKEAEDLLQNIELTKAQWCELAAFFTAQADKTGDPREKETLAARAITALQHAVEQGHDATQLSSDPRFQPLVQRSDFKQLCQGK